MKETFRTAESSRTELNVVLESTAENGGGQMIKGALWGTIQLTNEMIVDPQKNTTISPDLEFNEVRWQTGRDRDGAKQASRIVVTNKAGEIYVRDEGGGCGVGRCLQDDSVRGGLC